MLVPSLCLCQAPICQAQRFDPSEMGRMLYMHFTHFHGPLRYGCSFSHDLAQSISARVIHGLTVEKVVYERLYRLHLLDGLLFYPRMLVIR